MTTEIERDAAALSAATTGAQTPAGVKIDRPTSMSEWTMIGAGVASVIMASAIIAILTWGPWHGREDHQRIWFLGVAALMLVGCVMLMIAALISPSVGHISARAGPGGLEGEIDGEHQG